MASDKRVLLATPCASNVPLDYVEALVACLRSTFPGFEIKWRMARVGQVGWARNLLAERAIAEDYDRLVFWDTDMFERSPQLHVAHLARLLSHDLPVVASMYVSHKFPSVFHGVQLPGAAVDANGTLRMHQIPLGFSSISVDTLKQLVAATPELAYGHSESGAPPRRVHNLFGMELLGPNTATGKLERLKKLDPTSPAFASLAAAILHDSDYTENTMYGEDYFFCHLCNQHGIPLHTDAAALMPHQSHVLLPLTVEDMKADLAASWRTPGPELPKQ